MSNSLSQNESNSTLFDQQNQENIAHDEILTNNQNDANIDKPNNFLAENNQTIAKNEDLNEEEDIKKIQNTDLNEKIEPTINNYEIQSINLTEEEDKKESIIDKNEEEKAENIINKEEEEENVINENKEEDETNLNDKNEEANMINTNEEEESNIPNNYQYYEEENENEEMQNEFFVEEEEEMLESEEPVVVIDSDIEYSIDSEDELIDEIFDENRPTIIVRRNYQDEFDKRSVKSLRSVRSSRSNKSIKKRHISKIQKYNVTRPFTKTEHFDTKPNPDNEEFKEEHEPIRYAGSKDFLKRQANTDKRRAELRSQEPTERGFDPPLYTKKEKNKNPNPTYNWRKPKSEAEGYVSDVPANSYLEDLFRQSVKKPPVVVEEPLPEMYKVNRLSNTLARQKNQNLIEVITGKEKTISLQKFISIMRRFNISNTPEPDEPYAQRPLICKIKDIVQLDDDKFDNVKLRNLLINAMIGENMDEVTTELRPPVLAAFSNIRPSYIIPRRNLRKQADNNKGQISTQKKDNKSHTSIKSQNEKKSQASSRRKSIDKNKIEVNDDYTTDDDSVIIPPKKNAKAKTPQKKASNSSVPVNDNKAKTVKSRKQRKQQNPEPEPEPEPEIINENGKRKRRHRKKKNSNADNQSVENLENVNMESNEPSEKDMQTPKKKEVRPKQPTSRGAKYFPGFYDNLDFYVNSKSPRKH